MPQNSPSAFLPNTSSPLYSYSAASPQASPVAKTFAEGGGGGGESRALARHSSTAYERIRTVGKGSFGIAVLYRRKEDNSFVILKEINLHELTPAERSMSLNEVALLSRLDHPHIIHYFDSFEEDGTLMIEMEYADGGTLAQMLARREGHLLPEGDVIDMFEQMTSAVSYLHDNDILHRDLKAANIFLSKERMVKVGDFGVSKKMSTQTNLRGGAQTMLGTPYYLSPEMCQGRSYNAKSDMWAMGCCLYEMCTLRKPFDADNLTLLIHKIINCEYEPLKAPYSHDIQLIVRELFRTDPEQRPSAAELLGQIRRKNPSLNSTRRVKSLAAQAASAQSGGTSSNNNCCYSALYRFDVEKMTLLAMSELPDRVQIKQIALSVTHQLVLTVDDRVYSWGENNHGQLGHGDRRVRAGPTLIDALRDKAVSRVAAGKHFSLFCAGRGIAMVAGHRQFVGSAQTEVDLLKPKIIEALLKEDIVDVCCGEEHAAVLTENGAVFVWGVGEDGRLGTGDTENVIVPRQIQIPTRQLINSIVCGPNTTMLITNTGTVLAMGSNMYNKLNLNQRSGFFANAKRGGTSVGQKLSAGAIDNVLTPTAVKPFPSRVVNASLGQWHSGVLLENGHVHLFGRNLAGELGHGHCAKMPDGCTSAVKALLAKACVHLVCGAGYTMVGTLDNELYSWGMHKWGMGEEEQQRHKSHQKQEQQRQRQRQQEAKRTMPSGEDGGEGAEDAGPSSGCSSPSLSSTTSTSLISNTIKEGWTNTTRKKKMKQKMAQQLNDRNSNGKCNKKMGLMVGDGTPHFELSQTREGKLVRLMNGDDIKDKSMLLQPHLMFRLGISPDSFGTAASPGGSSSTNASCQQPGVPPTGTAAAATASVANAGYSSTAASTAAGEGVQTRLALSALVGTHSRVFCVVDVATNAAAADPLFMAQQQQQQQKSSSEFVRDKNAKKTTVPKRVGISRRCSAPDASATKPRTATWIRQELESAEIIPYSIDSSTFANSAASIRTASTSRTNMAKSAQRLRDEIAALRTQLAEHKNTVRGHQSQMSQLQAKLAELESLLRQHQSSPGGLPPVNGPPPAYWSSSVPSPRAKSDGADAAEQQQRKHCPNSASTTCAIL